MARLQLPAFPTVAMRVMNILESEIPGFARLGAIISTDAMLSAAILRACNSALYSHRSPIQDIDTALQILGMDSTTLLVLTHATYQLSMDVPPATSRRWWRHNFATALYAQHLTDPTAKAQHSYLPGLMHSIGQLALYRSYPSQYRSLVTSPAAHQYGIFETERRAFDSDHCELGGALLAKWNLPRHVVDAAANHHATGNAEAPSTHLIHPSCLLANASGFCLFPDQPDESDALPDSARILLDDPLIRDTVTRTVANMESALFPSN